MFSILIGSFMMLCFLGLGFVMGIWCAIFSAKAYLKEGKTLEDFVSTNKKK
ncbi:hypothetical protein PSYJYH_000067 [Bacillus phage PSYJ-YH]|nr:hypothetical protein PSYJYH_000067 [Bacillus phage PSYJ-YH]